MAAHDPDLKIVEIRTIPTSFAVRPEDSVSLNLGRDGCDPPLEMPGIGVEVDEDFLARHPVIEGPGCV